MPGVDDAVRKRRDLCRSYRDIGYREVDLVSAVVEVAHRFRRQADRRIASHNDRNRDEIRVVVQRAGVGDLEVVQRERIHRCVQIYREPSKHGTD